MNRFTEATLNYLAENWDRKVASGGLAAEMIGVNQNTLRARIKSGRAMAFIDADGRTRASVDYTGFHLVYNMMFDRLARFGITLDDDDMLLLALAVKDDVVTGKRNIETILRVEVRDDVPVVHWFDSASELGAFTGDAALILPIGTLVIRLAATLVARNAPDVIRLALNAD